jgi:hypothetical protein
VVQLESFPRSALLAAVAGTNKRGMTNVWAELATHDDLTHFDQGQATTRRQAEPETAIRPGASQVVKSFNG